MSEINQEFINQLRLYRSNNIGAISFKYLMEKFGSATNAIEHIQNNTATFRNKIIQLIDEKIILNEIDNTLKFGANFIFYKDNNYPEIFKMIHDVPPILVTLGNVNLLKTKIISIVGSRIPSVNGINFCKRLVNTLTQNNFTICSGFATGIDYYAHLSSVKTGTIAVFAGGIDVIYPSENNNLFIEMKNNNNLFITDRSIGTQPLKNLFPKRNFIIAALGIATCVIESQNQSGALITAEKALEYKKKVFAVPGHPFDEKYAGNNFLLEKKNAHLLLSYDSILTNLNNNTLHAGSSKIFEPFLINEKHLSSVLDLISFSPTDINDIIRISGLATNYVLSILAELELNGDIIIDTLFVYRI